MICKIFISGLEHVVEVIEFVKMTICQSEALGTYFDYPLTGLTDSKVGFYIRKI